MQQWQWKLHIAIDIYKDHICTQWITFMGSRLYNCDCSMVILFENTIPKNRIYHIIGKVASMEATMTLEDSDWYFYLELTYVCSMKYIERFRVDICDASMNIVIYINESPKFICTMIKQRSRNWLNNYNRGLRMGKSFTLNVFGFEEVLCMIKMFSF